MNWSDIGKYIGDAAPVIGGLLGGPAGSAVGGLIAKTLGAQASPDSVMQALKGNPDAVVKVKQIESDQQTQLANIALQYVTAQTNINKTEAASGNLFVSGWRPYIGWVCGMAFAWTFVAQPMIAGVLSAVGHSVALPAIDLSQMMPVLLGLLGLGGYRTYEKLKGVNQRHG